MVTSTYHHTHFCEMLGIEPKTLILLSKSSSYTPNPSEMYYQTTQRHNFEVWRAGRGEKIIFIF